MKNLRNSVWLSLLAVCLMLFAAGQTYGKTGIMAHQVTEQSSVITAQTDWIGTGHHSQHVFNSLSSSIPTICKEQSKVLYLLKDTNKTILAHAFGQYANFVTNLLLLSKQQALNFPFHSFW